MNATVATNKIAAKLSALASKGITVTVPPPALFRFAPRGYSQTATKPAT
jgi:hypothetical protein